MPVTPGFDIAVFPRNLSTCKVVEAEFVIIAAPL